MKMFGNFNLQFLNTSFGSHKIKYRIYEDFLLENTYFSPEFSTKTIALIAHTHF